MTCMQVAEGLHTEYSVNTLSTLCQHFHLRFFRDRKQAQHCPKAVSSRQSLLSPCEHLPPRFLLPQKPCHRYAFPSSLLSPLRSPRPLCHHDSRSSSTVSAEPFHRQRGPPLGCLASTTVRVRGGSQIQASARSRGKANQR